MMKRGIISERPWLVALGALALLGGAVLLSVTKITPDRSLLCSLSPATITSSRSVGGAAVATPLQLHAILHYATSPVVPQQSQAEIRVSFDVLLRYNSCNFLVFGLGHDSLMWSAFNAQGTTLFLEEDPKWYKSMLSSSPSLHAHTVRYPTRLSDADALLAHSRSEPSCRPPAASVPGDGRCRLALSNLPTEVYAKQWDLIMIDAPRGYAGDLPGRMSAIYSAAVMARNRKAGGVTHVFLHDVDRRVERVYAEAFLCRKYLVKAVGRLWHFEIPPAYNTSTSFCS